MNTQTKVKEEIIKEFDGAWTQDWLQVQLRDFLSQSLDRLEQSVREETIKQVLKIVNRTDISVEDVEKEIIKMNLEKNSRI